MTLTPFIMANILLNDGVEDIFVYTGGEQEVPRDVKRVRIAENVDTVPRDAFRFCQKLLEVKGHDMLKKIEIAAFHGCRRLRRVMKMNDVIEIERSAFYGCNALSDLEFGKLEIIGYSSFECCRSLRSIYLPSVRRVERSAFDGCTALTDAVFGEDLEWISLAAFLDSALRRIAIPLKDNLIYFHAFDNCHNLSRVDIVGGIHETISSLHMKSWRDEMKEEIDRMNKTIPQIQASEKTTTIQEWIRSVIDRMEHYKAEHQILLEKAMTLLELALWKAKLEENESNIDAGSLEVVRKQHRVTCGASIVINNVLPFLVLK